MREDFRDPRGSQRGGRSLPTFSNFYENFIATNQADSFRGRYTRYHPNFNRLNEIARDRLHSTTMHNPPQPVPPPAQGWNVQMNNEVAADTKPALVEDMQQGRPTSSKSPPLISGGVTKVTKGRYLDNQRRHLRKLLKPKNSVSVINQILGSSSNYTITPITRPLGGFEQVSFKAVLNAFNKDFEGFGASKMQAKYVAAEEAIKHVALTTILPNIDRVELDGDVIMENEDKDQEEQFRLLKSLGNFAMYKLMLAWEDTNQICTPMNNQPAQQQNEGFVNSTGKITSSTSQMPAKQLPPNAELLNPVMLLNQMCPGVVYEVTAAELLPDSKFTMQCKVNEKTFTGSGSNKKAAKRAAAADACKTIFNINYEEN